MDQLKPLHIQGYYTNRLTEGRMDGKGGLSNRSVLHHHRVLNEALNHAVKWQLLPINPVNAITPPKPQKKKITVLTKEQVISLLQGTKGYKYYYPIYLAVNTGMRRGEILGLRWEDIDFSNHTISINQTLQKLKGIGLQFRDTTKTDGSRRSIAISESVVETLKRLKTVQAKNKLRFGPTYQDHDLVFCNKDGSPFDPDNVSREFCRYIKRLEIPHVRFHDLRHTHATLLLQQGEHPKVVSERLGHSTIAITMDIYSHVMPNMQKEAAKKFDDFLFGN
ncbi:tyrosine-type recombinase/integrase [Laceyella tengchongensis]|nr:tyrosine-type recombinase/integrase [Laceyella tengchongensis]